MELEELRRFRRYLHAHPELSTQEVKTQQYLKKELEKVGVKQVVEAGGTGLLVHFKGAKSGKKIALRADMDALPIAEINDFEHRSIHEGVSHKCGHDGHTTVMLGVAAHLVRNPPERGEVLLIFQPAEENGRGARAILEDAAFDFAADQFFAFHNLPGLPLHQVVCKKDSFTAAAKSLIIKLKGKTSHAAEPEKGINPGLAISKILALSQQQSQVDTSKDNFRLVTMVYVTMGEKSYGVSAGYGEVHFTLRSWKNEVMKELEDDLLREVNTICGQEGLQLETEWKEIFHANENDHQAYTWVKEAAEEAGFEFKTASEPFKWGEDFGLFTERFRGAMFGIGAGENTPALHNPDYDYPDEITPTAIRMFVSILERNL